MSTKIVTDQMGFEVEMPSAIKRVISLVPSQTELLFDLGLANEIVGVTKYCTHPAAKVKGVTKIGGTKKFRFETIDSLKPDLIIGNKEENYAEGIAKLKAKYPVWMSDVVTLQDSYDLIRAFGDIFERRPKSIQVTSLIKEGFKKLKIANQRKKVLYFIWRNPYMIAGNRTFINHMLREAGFDNLAIDQDRYPELLPEQIQDYDPELILLSSEPFPFQDKHIREFKALCPDAEVMKVDGEMFSWYGSRLRYAPAYFQELQKELIAISS